MNSDLVGKTIAGKYLIKKMIGTGAMGAIYKAEQVSLGIPVAIKVLHRHLLSDKTLSQRFHREARAASKIDHANCIRVTDFGQADNGVLYIAMEMVEGRDLAEALFHEYPLDDRRIVQILKQICLALDEAHANGVIHRDLKPENIMLNQRRNNADVVKVLDFGIAKLSEKSRGDADDGGFETVAGVVCGTPEYMSPEQARGETLDGRSDLYSLGIILYQLLTNTLPFTADTAIGVVTKHLTDVAQDPRMIRGDCNPDLAALALLLMSKKTADRPLDALATHRLLEKIEEGLGEKRTSTIVGSIAGLGPDGTSASDSQDDHAEIGGSQHSVSESPTVFVAPQRSVPTPVGTAMRLEVARVRNRSVLPWALTALVAVALSAYVISSPDADKPSESTEAGTVTRPELAPTAVAADTAKKSPPVPKSKDVENHLAPEEITHPGQQLSGAAGVVPVAQATNQPLVPGTKAASGQQGAKTGLRQGDSLVAAQGQNPVPFGQATAKESTSRKLTPALPKKRTAQKRSERSKSRKFVHSGHKSSGQDTLQSTRKEQLKLLLAKAKRAKRSGSWSQAIQAYKAALKLAPSRRYYKELGHAYRKSGSMSQACRYYRKYVRGLKGQRKVDAKASLAVFQCNL